MRPRQGIALPAAALEKVPDFTSHAPLIPVEGLNLNQSSPGRFFS